MLSTLASLLSLLAMVLAALAAGQPLAAVWPIARAGSMSQLAWRLCLGLIVAGNVIMLLAFAGCLHPFAIQLTTGLAALIGAAMLWTEHRSRANFKQAQWLLSEVDGSWPSAIAPGPAAAAQCPPAGNLGVNWVLALLVLLAGGGSLVVALSPATDGDALCYHLTLPKIYLQAGGFTSLPYHDNSTFPLLVEMLFLWGIALDGGVTAQLIHWLFGVLLAAATFELARDILGKRWATTAAAIAFLTPAVTNQMGAAFNDLALAVFTSYALVAWRRAEWLSSVSQGELHRADCADPNYGVTSSWRGASAFVPVGCLCGAALATKYVAFIFVCAAALVVLARNLLLRKRAHWHPQGLFVAIMMAAMVAGPWYVRAATERGNPVFPFLGQVFETDGPETDKESKRPLKTTMDLLTAPWTVTMHPERFGGRGHQLGSLFLALLPGLFLLRGEQKLWLLLALAGCYLVLWYALRQNIRFLLPMVPVLAIAAAAVWRRCQQLGRWPGLAVTSICVAALVLNAGQAAQRADGLLSVVLGLESRDEFLRRCDPAFAAAEYARQLPQSASILSQDYRLYYFPCTVTRENIYRRETDYLHRNTAAALDQQLVAAGFTHVLLMDAKSAKVKHSTSLSKAVRSDERKHKSAYRTLLTYEHRLPSGEVRKYRLVELTASHLARPSLLGTGPNPDRLTAEAAARSAATIATGQLRR